MKFILPVQKRGFTLIELLIVIALLGALAVGLIGAIDPFEQLKKGTDTGVRDLVSQVQTAVIRYYSVKNNFPDWTITPGTSYQMATIVGGTVTINSDINPGLQEIMNAGELTTDFSTVHGGQLVNIFLTQTNASDANSAKVAVCYQPQSKSFQTDPNTKYCKDGTVPGDADATCSLKCTSLGGAGNTQKCFWCIQ